MKIMQNHSRVARKQGLAKIEYGACGVDFGSHFGFHFHALEGIFFSDFNICFCISFFGIFFDAMKHANKASNKIG